ncbi:hypothetical protein GOBAR_AA29428 [Gossypium barbadense]|uniref:Uncharacterized protein n=1 Tax=Gossypium barbadense TaxID=3634 RepID=A0A2P5WJJ1_GOSBA|nr:hypothetical protein GOBAR_AA29428 [Gossypium barbadense]
MEEGLEGLSLINGEEAFYYEVDLDRFLEESPWMFNNHLLLFHRLREDPMVVPLFWSNFWVQVHDLQTGLMSETMARQFGDFLGQLLEYDTKSLNKGYGGYMQIRFLEEWIRGKLLMDISGEPLGETSPLACVEGD